VVLGAILVHRPGPLESRRHHESIARGKRLALAARALDRHTARSDDAELIFRVAHAPLPGSRGPTAAEELAARIGEGIRGAMAGTPFQDTIRFRTAGFPGDGPVQTNDRSCHIPYLSASVLASAHPPGFRCLAARGSVAGPHGQMDAEPGGSDLARRRLGVERPAGHVPRCRSVAW